MEYILVSFFMLHLLLYIGVMPFNWFTIIFVMIGLFAMFTNPKIPDDEYLDKHPELDKITAIAMISFFAPFVIISHIYILLQ